MMTYEQIEKLKEGDLCWDSSSGIDVSPILVRINKVCIINKNVSCTEEVCKYNHFTFGYEFVSIFFKKIVKASFIWSSINQ